MFFFAAQKKPLKVVGAEESKPTQTFPVQAEPSVHQEEDGDRSGDQKSQGWADRLLEGTVMFTNT